MKILYVHQYFRTPDQGGCTRSYHLAKSLVQAGMDVEMITTHSSGYALRDVDGITVRYLPIPYDNRFGFLRRIWSFWQFARLALREAEKIKKIDLAYVMTTPLTTGLIALKLKRKRNIPYYFEVGDLWPEAPIQMGVIRSKLLKSLLFKFEKKCYFEAQKVIALSPDIRNYIEKVSPLTKVYVIPNISHCDFFHSQMAIKSFSPERPFKICYAGAMGKANHLDFLLGAARASQLAGLPLQFHLMGEGGELPRIKRQAKKLSNVYIHPFGSKDEVKTLLEESDAVYVSFKNVPILETGSPNKFFEGLAAGKLVIVNFKGWVREVIHKHECGFYHPPLRHELFVKRISRYIKDPNMLLDAQLNARKIAEQYYSKQLLCQKLVMVLNNERSMAIDDSEIHILTA